MSAPDDRVLWLIRHGETEWSLNGRHTSVTDLPLTDEGRAQAGRLAPHLAARRFAAIVVSPRLRARQTCELSGAAGPPPIIDEDLAEWCYGDYEGLTSAQIRVGAPRWSLWTDGAPGGESPAAICARVDRLIARYHAGEGPVAFFGHGHVLRVVALRWLGWPLEQGAQLGLDTASIGRLGTAGGARCLLGWNRAS